MPLKGSDAVIKKQLLDPEINRDFGERYLNALLNRYGGDPELALAAYNQGAGKADKVVGSDEPLLKFAELFEKEAEEAVPYVRKIVG